MARIEVNGLCGFVFDDGADAPAARVAPEDVRSGDLPTPGEVPSGAESVLEAAIATRVSRMAIRTAHGSGLGFASATLRRFPPMWLDTPD